MITSLVATVLMLGPPTSRPASIKDTAISVAAERLEKARDAATGELPGDAKVVDKIWPPRFREPIMVLADGTWHIRLPYWKKKAIEHFEKQLQEAKTPAPIEPLPVEALHGKPVAILEAGTNGFQTDDIIIVTSHGSVGQVKLRDVLGDVAVSKNQHTIIPIGIKNTSATRKLEYRSFANSIIDLGEDYAVLTDEQGNNYRRIDFDFGTVIGAVNEASIYPGKMQLDILVFQRPVPGTKTLTLTLPAECIGQTGSFVVKYTIR